MNRDFAAAMRRAVGLTRATEVAKATRVIRDALAGRTAARSASKSLGHAPPGSGNHAPRRLRLAAEVAGAPGAPPTPTSAPSAPRSPKAGEDLQPSPRTRRPLGEVLHALRAAKLRMGAIAPLRGANFLGLKGQAPAVPDGAQFETRSFACAEGARDYKLYIPASAAAEPRGLVVMLHGCRQDPDDFAAGTDMNAVGEARGLLVAYPAQMGSANPSSCWNWFNPADQARDAGEPSIIAGITREVMVEFGLDQQCVFVAGLSAGGAMAAVMSETYPDLYAAVGIHSGLAYRSANDVVSAFAAMRGSAGANAYLNRRPTIEGQLRTRLIVFQGSEDQTVHPSNADRIVTSAVGTGAVRQPEEHGGSAGGRGYTRSVVLGSDGVPIVECWMIEGAGHAWSGGKANGSFTDPRGPNASAEMVRFFLSA